MSNHGLYQPVGSLGSVDGDCLTCLYQTFRLREEQKPRAEGRSPVFKRRIRANLLEKTSGRCKVCHVIWTGLCLWLSHEVLSKPDTLVELYSLKNAFRTGTFGVYVTYSHCPDSGAAGFEFYASQDDDRPSPFIDRYTTSFAELDFGSQECLDQLNGWIAKCALDHQECCTFRTFAPKRLLRITTNENGRSLRLQQTTRFEKLAGKKYAALSYCWGSYRRIMLTEATFSSMLLGVPLLELPKTYQDAVTICIHLGIEYLWIDSLCILQDSSSDWDEQAAEMASIYEHAYITIAASHARDAEEGILVERRRSSKRIPRTEEGTAQMFVRRSIRGSEMETLHELYTHKDLYMDSLKRNMHADTLCPLMTRAWPMQERFLSTRIVHFTPLAMIFECREGQICECCDKGSRGLATLGVPLSRALLTYFSQELGPDDCGLQMSWYHAVAAYSSLGMTKPEDKLPAFSGLAKHFKDNAWPTSAARKLWNHVWSSAGGLVESPAYYAGLWSSFLPLDLLWSTRGSDPAASRPSNYAAPSWSWASVAGTIHWPWVDGGWQADKQTQILSVECTPRGQDPYGFILSGIIEIEGFVCAMREKESNGFVDGYLAAEQAVATGRTFSSLWTSIGQPPIAKGLSSLDTDGWEDDHLLYFDFDILAKPETCPDIVYGIRLARSGEEEVHHTYHGLLLQPVSRDLFKRVGIFSGLQDHGGVCGEGEVRRIRIC
ncbi:heterokaryon incompatibility protein-domain-containing protein [Macrophomina phaseolina]|uniref:Heterokaryon incompatibility protein-domain-containing protein n=1 Tax=Macrophomina phaseolina TaxID=35725 RepID=A0ABQ8G788_9PEZI|nr:heterokaryon incompatibility protein-domain-containing protein [Macrophomina phaseolina]